MPNFTIEDYKEAIRAKYEKDINNPLSDDLRLLGQAYLRNYCWEKFEGGLDDNDLKVFASFFGFEFNSLKRNLFKDKTDKFRPIGTFLKRETDLTSREAVDLTAILVDFQHRPFRKFKEKGIINYLKHPENSKIPESFAGEYEQDEVDDLKKARVSDFVTSEEIEVRPKAKTGREEIKPISFFIIVKEKIWEKLTKKILRTGFFVTVLLGLGFILSYYFFPKKQCMQWNNNHYDIVDCDFEKNGVMVSNVIEPLDENRVELKKIKVYDTTTFFKNGKPTIFYARAGDSLECFNQIGPHPERSSQYLKPITPHMINKYLRK